MRITWLLLGFAISFTVTWLSGFWFIPALHKLKFGQPIKDIGPTWHASKKGTPTMGGFMFITGIVLALVIVMSLTGGAPNSYGYDEEVFGINGRLVAGIVMAVCYALCGFIDDYAKVKRGHNTGLNRLQKLVLQILISGAFLWALYHLGHRATTFWIPFAGDVELGLFYYPLVIFILIATVNAVNIHDGIDGLCASTTAVASLAFLAVSVIDRMFGGMLLSVVTVGGCLGFLIWNKNPAKVIMGDTGSHFFGALLVAMSFIVNKPILLISIGLIYVIETGSVILQGISFRTTGKRIFKMSPIHHHYELVGWSENKIVAVFSAVAAVGGLIGVGLAWFGGAGL